MTERDGWRFFDDADAGAVVEAEIQLDRAYARAFSSEDGTRVLADLVAGTLGTVTPLGSPDTMLREYEGARRLVQTIENRIKRGRKK